jgi:hypothetical protein
MVNMADQRASGDERSPAPPDTDTEAEESRLAMLRRVKRMTIEQRIELFQSLVRDAAWARGARRVK